MLISIYGHPRKIKLFCFLPKRSESGNPEMEGAGLKLSFCDSLLSENHGRHHILYSINVSLCADRSMTHICSYRCAWVFDLRPKISTSGLQGARRHASSLTGLSFVVADIRLALFFFYHFMEIEVKPAKKTNKARLRMCRRVSYEACVK